MSLPLGNPGKRICRNLSFPFLTYPVNFSDAAIVLPASGSVVYLRVISQVNSCSNFITYHPGGMMTGAFCVLPANPDRLKYTVLNSGSLALGLNRGSGFDPRVNPPTPANHADNIVLGTVTLQGNQGVVPALVFESFEPVYTGPIFGAWMASGTLSGSTAIVTEFSNSR
jgi:hypothetical protein